MAATRKQTNRKPAKRQPTIHDHLEALREISKPVDKKTAVKLKRRRPNRNPTKRRKNEEQKIALDDELMWTTVYWILTLPKSITKKLTIFNKGS